MSNPNQSIAVDKFVVGPPTAAVVAPGNCQFNGDWTQAPLLEKVAMRDTRVFTFGLPDTSKSLGLATCACLLARGGKDEEGNAFVRPYTPISTNETVGKMDIMVKIYPNGKLTKHMDALKVGDTMEFKHIDKNVKLQYPFNKAHIGMVVGGTGITPCIQALHAILGTATDKTKVSVLYGSRTAEDILCRQVLDEWVKTVGSDRLEVTHVLSEEPAGTPWDGARGFINKELVEKHFPKPADDVLIVICGPPPLYKALSGPRDEAEVTGLLGELGYTSKNVYKF